MTELLVKGLNGQMEMLTDYREVKRKRRVNGGHSLSFYLLNTKNAQPAYNLTDKRSNIKFNDDEYIVIGINKRGHYGKTITAPHIFFDDMMDWQYNVRNGYTNFVQCMDFIFGGTGWKWINQGAFAATDFQNFGDDTRSSLLQKALNRYEAEMQIDNKNKTVIFKNQIGTVTDAQFRFGHNLKTFDEDTDMTNFATYIRGYGKDTNDNEFMVEYESPMAKIYGRISQKPIRDERYKTPETMLAACKRTINDVPDTRFKVSVANLIENGLSPLHKFDLGDYVYMLYEEAGVTVQIRVIEIEDHPTDPLKSPIVELSTFKELKTMSAIQAQFQQTQKQVQQLLDDSGNLNLALKRLYANTQVFTDHTGMWMIDPNDPNRYAHHGAGGSDYHKGMIRIERSDGYAVMLNGILQHSFDIQGSYPAYTSSSVKVEYKWWTTLNTVSADCQFYTFEHKSRYLMVHVALLATEGAMSYITVEEGANQNAKILAQASTSESSTISPIATKGEILTIDLGVPTGGRKSIYIRLRTSDDTKKAYGRVVRMWLER
ncbi:phage tail protein [Bacillus cereus]|uniref:Phage minor structural protein n=1 Tax=Bacillus cereus (strain VD146) TaxID=1053236 RepID=R8MQ66_BACCX|nr:phage tail protein [Bacillus cereus]EOP36179.1 phage minor structural protein [Bacillus cereus VD146]